MISNWTSIDKIVFKNATFLLTLRVIHLLSDTNPCLNFLWSNAMAMRLEYQTYCAKMPHKWGFDVPHHKQHSPDLPSSYGTQAEIAKPY